MITPPSKKEIITIDIGNKTTHIYYKDQYLSYPTTIIFSPSQIVIGEEPIVVT